MCTHSQDVALVGLAEALFCTDPDAVFVMLKTYTLYSDAGGGKDHGFIVVAGYLSTFEKWMAFREEWNILLATYGVPYFHMKEFSQSKGPYASWKDDEPKRARFMAKAAATIVRNVERGFANVVEFQTFERVDQTYDLSGYVGCPYALAGVSCAAKARTLLQRNDITYVFESGDEGAGDLLRIMQEDGFPAPTFRPSRDRRTKQGVLRGITQLQAADFAAYELRKVFKDDPGELWPFERYRKSLHALTRIPSEPSDWGRYTERDLIALCKKKRIRRR